MANFMFKFFNSKKNIIFCNEEFINNDKDYDELILQIKMICGIDLQIKKKFIKSKLIKFAMSNDIFNFLDFIKKLNVDFKFRQNLFNLITICETYFFRELKQLNEIIKLLKQNPNKRKILCVPCASGEEIYSILILANEMGINDISFVGVDINSIMIDKAKLGVYSNRSLLNLNKQIIDKYFYKYENNKYTIKNNIFMDIKYEILNVFDSDFLKLGKFDVIMSRNMMIYFDEEHKKRLVNIFANILNANGMLFTGHADLVPKHSSLNKIYLNNCIYYQKIV